MGTIDNKHDNCSLVGITEAGDAGIDFSWINKVEEYLFCILITKRLSDEFIQYALRWKDRLIIHITCTGWGGTALEPGANTLEQTYYYTKKLVRQGFPVSQLVLRVDPVIPTDEGLERAEMVLKRFHDSGIARLRYSFIDNYIRNQNRLSRIGMVLPWDGKDAPSEYTRAFNVMKKIYPYFCFESCAESLDDAVGCVSEKDYHILGLQATDNELLGIRRRCLCLSSKVELLQGGTDCPIGCAYCYWPK